MKKGQLAEGIIEKVEFPNKGIVTADDRKIVVKNTVAGQKVSFQINKMRKGKAEGRLLEVLERAPIEMESPCPHFTDCGGCTYQTLPYQEQLRMKAAQVNELLQEVNERQEQPYCFAGIKASPRQFEYRNKMEFSFGNAYKDGPLALGMHKRGSFYDIVSVPECRIIDTDYRAILTCVLAYFAALGTSFYHRMRHEGCLRHLLVRKGQRTGEILIALVTTTQEKLLLSELKERLLALEQKEEFEGHIVGILHTENDSLADVIQSDRTTILHGRDYFFEEILGLRFRISQFSFFQTNSSGAEVLYETARSFIGDLNADGKKDKVIFDLYSGTGTLAQMMAPVAAKVVGVEIVEEAVVAAKENAELNGLHNCEFLAGDVLKVLDEISDKPDFIILDPPRDGIHPKALLKICEYGVPRMIYISCKPTSLARDLEVLQERGYDVERVGCVDMFAGSFHVETAVLLVRKG